MDRLEARCLHRIVNPLRCCRHHHCYLCSSGVLAGGDSQVTPLHRAHFIFIRRSKAESALLGFAPVVPGSLGISNLRLRPLIIPLSQLNTQHLSLQNWGGNLTQTCFPQRHFCICLPVEPRTSEWHRRFSFETRGLIKVLHGRPGPFLIDGLLTAC